MLETEAGWQMGVGPPQAYRTAPSHRFIKSLGLYWKDKHKELHSFGVVMVVMSTVMFTTIIKITIVYGSCSQT